MACCSRHAVSRARELDVGERDHGVLRRPGGDRLRRGGERVAERLVAELVVLAQAHQQHALGVNAWKVMHQQRGARLSSRSPRLIRAAILAFGGTVGRRREGGETAFGKRRVPAGRS